MGRRGVTEEEAFAAAQALLEAGQEPSVRLIQERTGGSYSTITRHFDNWRAQRGDQAPAQLPDMPDNVMAALRQVWATAARTAQEGMSAERDALEAARREMEQRKTEMVEEIDRLEKELEEAKRQLWEERTGKAKVEEEARKLQVENVRLGEQVQAAERRADEFKEQAEGFHKQVVELARPSEPKARPGRTSKAQKPEPS